MQLVRKRGMKVLGVFGPFCTPVLCIFVHTNHFFSGDYHCADRSAKLA